MGCLDLTSLSAQIYSCSPSYAFTTIQKYATSAEYSQYTIRLGNRHQKTYKVSAKRMKGYGKYKSYKKQPICILGNSVITIPVCTSKLSYKTTCLIKQVEHHNLLLGIEVNRCMSIPKAKAVPVTLVNTNMSDSGSSH